MCLNVHRFMPRSLRWRLLLVSLLVVAPALTLLAWQLSHTFEQSVEARVHRELENHLNQLIARVRPLPDGKLKLVGHLSDPRFNVPLSGLYWQVNDGEKPLLRSRSLWDSALAVTADMPMRGGVHEYVLKGPRGEDLYALVRGVWLDVPPAKDNATAADATADAKAHRYIFTVAVDHGEISAAETEFNRQLYVGLAALALILLATLVAQIVWGLKPLDRLRRQLESVRAGERKQLSAPDVAELDPLINDLNALLKAQERNLEEARARAGNLAHGMKTPLAVLGARAQHRQRRFHAMRQVAGAGARFLQVPFLCLQQGVEVVDQRIQFGHVRRRKLLALAGAHALQLPPQPVQRFQAPHDLRHQGSQQDQRQRRQPDVELAVEFGLGGGNLAVIHRHGEDVAMGLRISGGIGGGGIVLRRGHVQPHAAHQGVEVLAARTFQHIFVHAAAHGHVRRDGQRRIPQRARAQQWLFPIVHLPVEAAQRHVEARIAQVADQFQFAVGQRPHAGDELVQVVFQLPVHARFHALFEGVGKLPGQQRQRRRHHQQRHQQQTPAQGTRHEAMHVQAHESWASGFTSM